MTNVILVAAAAVALLLLTLAALGLVLAEAGAEAGIVDGGHRRG